MENPGSDQRSTEPEGTLETRTERNLAHRLGTMGWALFFLWVGIALLSDLSYGVGLLGVGIITLGMQMLRVAFQMKLEGFWVVVGSLFVGGGLGELVKPGAPLLPFILLIAGLLLLLSIARGRRHKG